MFAQIYEGCNCLEGTYKVVRNKIIDTERDDVWEELTCEICGKSVVKEKMVDGKLIVHPLSDDEIRAEMGYYGEGYDHEFDDDIYD